VVEIFVNNTRLDLIDNVSIPITYSISDIKNPQSREGTYSKTITLPGTKTNNKLFTHIFKINKLSQSGDFNPNLKADCLIIEDSVEILRGSLRLADISYLEDGEILYNCVVFGETTDLFFSINNKKLTDLDLSLYDHTWSRTNIINSWTATKGVGYVYPMIDYGTNTDASGANWAVTDFYPAIYAKQYLDKIFSEAGYTYTSSFFTSDFFKSLIVPFNKASLKLTIDDINAEAVDVGLSATQNQDVTVFKNNFFQSEASGALTINNFAFTLENKDPSGNYTSGTFTAPRDGYYNTQLILNELSYSVVTYPTGTSSVVNEITDYWVRFKKNGAIIGGGVYFQTYNGNTNTETVFYPTYFLNAGDTLTVDLRINIQVTFNANITGSSTGVIRTTISTTNSYLRVTLAEQLNENAYIPIRSVIPENIFCKDFLGSLIKMFNLYIEPDKNNQKNLIIKPRDTFYSDETSVLNWTDKINRNVPFKITPLGELDFKKLILRYKDDNDLLNKKYKNSWLEPFGTKTLNIDNDFVTSERVIEPIFSATPSYRAFNAVQLRVIPQIINEQVRQPIASNIRLISYYGTKSTSSWGFTSTLASTSVQTVYPFAGMLDDADNPTFDLSFDTPKEIYFSMNQANYTNNNLYNAYYSKMFSEITDQDSKLIECEVFLTAQDILNINFAKKIFIDDSYYILNKIIDADRVNSSLVKCELLKLKFGTPFISSTGVGNSYNNSNVQSIRVDGGQNIVGSSLNGSPAIIEGGKNEVRNIGATSDILIVNGGLN
jgi:hypothetical protein